MRARTAARGRHALASQDARILAPLAYGPGIARAASVSAVELNAAGPMDRPLDPRIHRARIARRVALAAAVVAAALGAFAALARLLEPSLGYGDRKSVV